jgi:hypothetical protein
LVLLDRGVIDLPRDHSIAIVVDSKLWRGDALRNRSDGPNPAHGSIRTDPSETPSVHIPMRTVEGLPHHHRSPRSCRRYMRLGLKVPSPINPTRTGPIRRGVRQRQHRGGDNKRAPCCPRSCAELTSMTSTSKGSRAPTNMRQCRRRLSGYCGSVAWASRRRPRCSRKADNASEAPPPGSAGRWARTRRREIKSIGSYSGHRPPPSSR